MFVKNLPHLLSNNPFGCRFTDSTRQLQQEESSLQSTWSSACLTELLSHSEVFQKTRYELPLSQLLNLFGITYLGLIQELLSSENTFYRAFFFFKHPKDPKERSLTYSSTAFVNQYGKQLQRDAEGLRIRLSAIWKVS